MFQRFTDISRRVVVTAQEEARALAHTDIGAEHMVLALFGVRPVDPVLVAALPEVRLETARDHLVWLLPVGGQAPAGHMPFTPAAKRTLELGLRAAMRTGHSNVEPGHLLLALLDDPGAARLLTELGIDTDQLRDTVTTELETARTNPGQTPDDRLVALEQQVRRLTEQVEELRRHLGRPDGPEQAGEG